MLHLHGMLRVQIIKIIGVHSHELLEQAIIFRALSIIFATHLVLIQFTLFARLEEIQDILKHLHVLVCHS